MIKAESLNFSYGGTQVLRDASVSIGGGICGLLGENGAGKTTLMRILLGLLKGNGTYSVMGFDPWTLDPAFLREIYWVPEDGIGLKITPLEYAGRLSPFYPGFIRDVLEEDLDILDVPPDRPFSRMSFGQRKKASIAVSLSMNTRMVLMDEPTNGLDIPSKVALRSILMSDFNGDNGRCLLLSTHQVRDIEELVSSVAVISDGQIVYEKVTADVNGGRIDLERLFVDIISQRRS